MDLDRSNYQTCVTQLLEMSPIVHEGMKDTFKGAFELGVRCASLNSLDLINQQLKEISENKDQPADVHTALVQVAMRIQKLLETVEDLEDQTLTTGGHYGESQKGFKGETKADA